MKDPYTLPAKGDILPARENNPDNRDYCPPPPALASAVEKQEWYQRSTQHRAWSENNLREQTSRETYDKWLLSPTGTPPTPLAALVCVCNTDNGSLEIKPSGEGETTVDDTSQTIPPSGPYIPVYVIPK